MGLAALEPVSPFPRDFSLSKPTQTPVVYLGVYPKNQASLRLFVVPVFPAAGLLRALTLHPVPDFTTLSRIFVII